MLSSGCATLAWYGQAASGQLDLLSRREHIADLLADPATDPELKRRLALVLEMRDFAVAELGLPDSRSYTRYADLERDAAVWNVVAAPAFSLAPRRWCYPMVGCLAYRGFFDRERASALAGQLADEGYDSAVFPAVAYSTLGWFADPVLNTMLAWDDARLAGFIFHELAHEKLFVRGDTAFNEAYATLIEREGLRAWLTARAELDALAAWESDQALSAALTETMLAAREELTALYQRDWPPATMAAAKDEAFRQLGLSLAATAAAHGHPEPERWTARPLNNAHLAMAATYEAGVAAFAALFADCAGSWTCFHQRSRSLASESAEARRHFLDGEP